MTSAVLFLNKSSSKRKTWVKEYTKADGTRVPGHYQDIHHSTKEQQVEKQKPLEILGGDKTNEDKTPVFESYSDAHDWVGQRAKKLGVSVTAFAATDEYKSVYPHIKALYESEKAVSSAAKMKLLGEKGLSIGDSVSFSMSGSLLSAGMHYTGKIFIKKGAPYVRVADGKVAVSSKGKIRYTSEIPWDARWEKSKPDDAVENDKPKKQLSEAAQVASAVRKYLKAKGIQAKVRSENYSMGNSVNADIMDVDPKTYKKIAEDLEQYSEGSYDGMNDIYEHKKGKTGPTTKYLFLNRKFSDELEAKAWKFIRGYWKGGENLPENIKDGAVIHFQGQWGSQLVYQTLVNDGPFWDEKGKAKPDVEQKVKADDVTKKAEQPQKKGSYAAFVESIAKQGGILAADAEKVMEGYLSVNLVKLDPVTGNYNPKHGGLLDKETIRTALKNLDKKDKAGSAKEVEIEKTDEHKAEGKGSQEQEEEKGREQEEQPAKEKSFDFDSINGKAKIKVSVSINDEDEIEIAATVDGKAHESAGINHLSKPLMVNGQKVVATIGKVGLTEENLKQAEAAVQSVQKFLDEDHEMIARKILKETMI